MERPSKDEYGLEIAKTVATRATCSRRKVGCVFTDQRGRILSTGYNGQAPGEDHCIDRPCPGAKARSGTCLDLCEAAHAEINALSFCPDINKVYTIYVTTSPCNDCIKALLNTSAQRIVFSEEYTQEPNVAKARWLRAGREWIHHAV